jgi:hypothetical protein
MRRVALSVLAGLAGLAVATPSLAYRPFDSTDADTAAPQEIEIEAGTIHERFGDSRTWTVPAVTFNYGLDGGREVVLNMAWQRETPEVGATRNTLTDISLSVKQVLRRGSLQGERGISVAAECAALAPAESVDRGLGGECTLIASRSWSYLAVHVNAGAAYERSHTWSQSYGVILEGPGAWRVRPVMELVYGHAAHEPAESAALVGVIWEAREHWAFDAAARRTHSDGIRGREWRAGFTWSH